MGDPSSTCQALACSEVLVGGDPPSECRVIGTSWGKCTGSEKRAQLFVPGP